MKTVTILLGCLTVLLAAALVAMFVAVKPQLEQVKGIEHSRSALFTDLGVKNADDLNKAVQDPAIRIRVEDELKSEKEIFTSVAAGWHDSPLYRLWQALSYCITWRPPEIVSNHHQFVPGIVETGVAGLAFIASLVIWQMTKPKMIRVRRRITDDDDED